MSILNHEIESWMEFPEALRSDDRQLFLEMIESCNQFSESFNTKGEEFSTGSLLTSLIYLQRKLINSLIAKTAIKSKNENYLFAQQND